MTHHIQKGNNILKTPERGDIFFADLSPVSGCEQGGVRPVVIVQNNMGNKHSPTVIVAAVTSSKTKAKLPTHIAVDANRFGLEKDFVILTEQIRTLDKKRLRDKVGRLDEKYVSKIDQALYISFGLPR